MITRRAFAATGLAALALPALPRPVRAADWQAVLDAAKGQTVWWHAWGGDPKINDFIAWVGEEAQARHGVTLEHVKLAQRQATRAHEAELGEAVNDFQHNYKDKSSSSSSSRG